MPVIVIGIVMALSSAVGLYFLAAYLGYFGSDLCHFHPRRTDTSILDATPTNELRVFTRGLDAGTHAFGLRLTGQEAASQLRYSLRFAFFYDEVLEEFRDSPRVTLADVVGRLNRIIADESAIDAIQPGDLRYSAVIYLRSFQQSECGFPNIFESVPWGSTVYNELKTAYPAFNGALLFSGNVVKFTEIYDATIRSAKAELNARAKVSAIKLGQLLRSAILATGSK